MKKKVKGIESLRRRYGYSFVSHWIFGLIMFFFIPLITSICYAFSNITITDTGFLLKFVGFSNFKVILLENADYLDLVREWKRKKRMHAAVEEHQ